MNFYRNKKSIIYFFKDFMKRERKYFKHYKRNIFIKKPINKQKNFEYYMFIYFVLISKMIIEKKERNDIEQFLISIHIQKEWKEYKFLTLFNDDEFINKLTEYLEKEIKIYDNRIFTNVITLLYNEIQHFF